MQTNKQLTEAYRHAKIMNFDKNSKIIIFSDTHRGDDSISDEFARNQSVMVAALKHYYKEGYTYIEAGDGDELWEHPKFQTIRAAHTDVFTELKKFFQKNRMIMLYGNHNIFLRNPYYVAKSYFYFYDEYLGSRQELFPNLLPIEALLLREKNTKQKILIVHGHQGDLMNDQLWFVNMILLRYFWRFMHIVGLKNPSSPAKNIYRRHKIEKNYTDWIKKHKVILICGHTHRLKFPKPREVPYFNSGCCIHTKGITGIEIVNNEIMVVQWRMEADEEGIFRSVRRVIRGPKPISEFRQ